jgi:hypothetical protein
MRWESSMTRASEYLAYSLDRNGRTVPETHAMSFRGEMLRKEDDGRLVPQNLRIWATPEEAGPVTAQTI